MPEGRQRKVKLKTRGGGGPVCGRVLLQTTDIGCSTTSIERIVEGSNVKFIVNTKYIYIMKIVIYGTMD